MHVVSSINKNGTAQGEDVEHEGERWDEDDTEHSNCWDD